MSRTLMIKAAGQERELAFEDGALLSDLLVEGKAPLSHPCGGRGTCKKCRVLLTDSNGSRSVLSCQTRLYEDVQVELTDREDGFVVELSAANTEEDPGRAERAPVHIGAAIDIGTTTVALEILDLDSGRRLSSNARLNAQTRVAADVMGRIGASLEGNGALLRSLIVQELSELLEECLDGLKLSLSSLVITGNTTMLYLLTGRDPFSLSRAPFLADTLFDVTLRFDEVFGAERVSWADPHTPVYLPPCMNAFVGADISCALLQSGLFEDPETAMLVDLGTNGEIALWHNGRLQVTSTAAGPAFEGALISCGCGSIPGAVDRVFQTESGSVGYHTLQEKPAVGICGSGLLDAVAVYLEKEEIDETGALDDDELVLSDSGLSLTQKDIRAVQLAKGAVAAGIRTVLDQAGLSAGDLAHLYIAGGFGSHLNVESAIRIGLIPEEVRGREVILGNAALGGAGKLLCDPNEKEKVRRMAAVSEHTELGGNPVFSDYYMDLMMFPMSCDPFST